MRNKNGRRSLAALVTAVLLALPTGTASATAATGPQGGHTAAAAPSAAPSAANARSAQAFATARRLNITMQAQQKDNWCWAASGNTIATWFGRNYSQNQFCNAAFNRQQGYDCPNWQASLGNVQNALSWAGIRTGSYVDGWLYYSTVQTEIDYNRPIETRIQWSNGGGHMQVVYGYDTDNSWVYWGDPWPSSYRYNWASHAWYVNNSSFSWTHSLYRIGA
ncbi:papain-like cysteine protease family protein [Streptomyces sp. NRRL S-87]|uniref:papain-like cysteine protease family protein n=1 Tax=Streptomyces sp. NRRL S-87 TaxID=1463920 RepID=UPI0004BFD2D0|nr:papain-like cysteine protease family protein [Streptomyces sp. NRRL S-87]